MSVTEQTTQSDTTISAEAYELLQCLEGILDGIIYEMAESAASKRQLAAGLPELPANIEVEDVQLAKESLTEAIRQGVAKELMPPDALAELNEASDCVESAKRR